MGYCLLLYGDARFLYVDMHAHLAKLVVKRIEEIKFLLMPQWMGGREVELRDDIGYTVRSIYTPEARMARLYRVLADRRQEAGDAAQVNQGYFGIGLLLEFLISLSSTATYFLGFQNSETEILASNQKTFFPIRMTVHCFACN